MTYGGSWKGGLRGASTCTWEKKCAVRPDTRHRLQITAVRNAEFDFDQQSPPAQPEQASLRAESRYGCGNALSRSQFELARERVQERGRAAALLRAAARDIIAGGYAVGRHGS